ncbi:protein hu-li tai shao isoform X9 [Rhipicephalus sanguineus]|uniref:protein hu-li tai shao isoform X9 n=1 Tax=Rhipicephalus sanguineus TaxID=34632 RepID=UPI001892D629|nr:protein hu-li tai shao isoform X9 [Rhipicephalus sanguineus]
MAETKAQTNGLSDGQAKAERYDPDDPEAQRQMWRPPDIEQDMKEMERRKRVEMIMNSQLFREELERIIESQLSEGYTPSNMAALQQVTELLLPHATKQSTIRGGRCLVPINDVRGIDGLRYSKGEKLLRCKLASLCRLLDAYGWTTTAFNHITLRVSQDQEHFLVNPFGLLYHEVTASSLLKLDMQSNVIDSGTTTFHFNRPAYMVHAAIHANRPDIKCIIHLQHPPCVAVSSLKQGLLPITPDAALLGEVTYHEYRGSSADTHEIARSLGPNSKVLFLRNHGVLVCGDSVEEAFSNMCSTIEACETQMKLAPIGFDNVHLLSEEAQRSMREEHARQKGVDEPLPGGDEDKEKAEPKEKPKRWRPCDIVFEAHMRTLDNSGHRTGYIYRQPLLRNEQPRLKTDVEVPPSASSIAQFLEEDKWLSPLKKLLDGRKTQDKLRWVNSPNTYQRVEVLETGTADPKKITKWVEVGGSGEADSWVQEGSPSHSTSVKIDTSHQFVPKGTDPAEFKRKQKELKENRLNSKINAGPQSNLLDGVTWEEVKKMQDAVASATGDQVVLVGAASKGIIQRDYQHNAMVYKTAYSKNPFDNITDSELEDYKRLVERKQRGESIDDDVPDSLKPLLVEPVAVPSQGPQRTSSPLQSPAQSPTSPASDEEDSKSSARVKRSLSSRLATEEEERIVPQQFGRRAQSERKPKRQSDAPVNGDEKLRSAESGDVSAASRSSKESSPVKDVEGESPKKDKKKKKGGLRTPSFLKKKKHRKEKEDKEKAASEWQNRSQ